MHDTITNAWADYWASVMLALLWQSTLVACLIALVARWLHRASPALRYWLWQIVAIKLLVMPLWSVSIPLAWLPDRARSSPTFEPMPVPTAVASAIQETMPSTIRDNRAAEVPSVTPPEVPSPILPALVAPRLSLAAWLFMTWLVVIAGQVAWLVWQRLWLGQLLRAAGPASPAIESLVAECAARLGLRGVPRVKIAAVECSPFVCRLVRPVIVLPRSLEALLSEEQLAPVLVHELAHVRRHDLLWNWLPQIARMIYFFHPVAHWAAFHIRLEGELACDAWAMSATGQEAAGYANLLVRVVSRLSEPALLRSGSAASAGLDGQTPFARKE